MNRQVVIYALTGAVAGASLLATVTILNPLSSSPEKWGELLFWIGLTLLASLFPVALPKGTYLTVSFATLLATVISLGINYAVWVAALGTFHLRELRGQVPWYGVLFNRADIVMSTFGAGIIYYTLKDVSALIALAGSALAYYLINNTLSTEAARLRTGERFRTIWYQDVTYTTLPYLALAPTGWMMAEIFHSPNLGPWATLFFVIPLFLARYSFNRYVEQRRMFMGLVASLSNAVESKDAYTAGHAERVAELATAIARQMHLTEREIEAIQMAGLLHDIGKIGVSDAILLKPGALSEEEFQLMQQHPTMGARIVSPSDLLKEEIPLIRHHHERYN